MKRGHKVTLGLENTGLNVLHEGCFKEFSTSKTYCCVVSILLAVGPAFTDMTNNTFLHFQKWEEIIYFKYKFNKKRLSLGPSKVLVFSF